MSVKFYHVGNVTYDKACIWFLENGLEICRSRMVAPATYVTGGYDLVVNCPSDGIHKDGGMGLWL